MLDGAGGAGCVVCFFSLIFFPYILYIYIYKFLFFLSYKAFRFSFRYASLPFLARKGAPEKKGRRDKGQTGDAGFVRKKGSTSQETEKVVRWLVVTRYTSGTLPLPPWTRGNGVAVAPVEGTAISIPYHYVLSRVNFLFKR